MIRPGCLGGAKHPRRADIQTQDERIYPPHLVDGLPHWLPPLPRTSVSRFPACNLRSCTPGARAPRRQLNGLLMHHRGRGAGLVETTS
jgi:hypothetical protein